MNLVSNNSDSDALLAPEIVDKSKAVGPCVHRANEQQRCPPEHYCVDEECYPKKPLAMMMGDDPEQQTTPQKQTKPLAPISKSSSIGPCVNGFCPAGYECVDNSCTAQSMIIL